MSTEGGWIYYVARTIPAYRVPVLRQLNDRLDGRLVCWYGRPPGSSSLSTIAPDVSEELQSRPLQNYWLSGERLHFQNFLPLFRGGERPAAIIAEESPRSLSFPLMIQAARSARIPIALWGHFSSNMRPFSPEHWADKYRLTLARRATACICYTDRIADLLRPYIEDRRIFVATNTLDTETLFGLYDELDSQGRDAVRHRLQLPLDTPLLAFIGRLIKDKGTDVLLDVMTQLQTRRRAGLVIIGDGPERVSMEDRVRNEGIEDVRFLGAIPSLSASAPYLYASDAMLLPGYVGLAVNHAFSMGLPVITQASPGLMRYHSPEADFIEHGKNGLLVEYGSTSALVCGVERVLDSREEFSRSARSYARRHLTIDRMVDGLESASRFLDQDRTLVDGPTP